MKIIFWLVLIILVILAIRKNSRASMMKHRNDQQQGFPHQANPAAGADFGSAGSSNSATSTNKPSEEMVCCAQCQVYVPVSEAIIKNNVSYCSVEHAQQNS